jgi:CheY-like chemotaxis protein
MADVLILDPSIEMQELFARVVTRLGHRAVFTPQHSLGLLLVEPASPDALSTALAIHSSHTIPVVCASTLPQDERVRPLNPTAYLLKPFPVSQLQRELQAALAPETNSRNS